jgi:hypothetical protein
MTVPFFHRFSVSRFGLALKGACRGWPDWVWLARRRTSTDDSAFFADFLSLGLVWLSEKLADAAHADWVQLTRRRTSTVDSSFSQIFCHSVWFGSQRNLQRLVRFGLARRRQLLFADFLPLGLVWLSEELAKAGQVWFGA